MCDHWIGTLTLGIATLLHTHAQDCSTSVRLGIMGEPSATALQHSNRMLQWSCVVALIFGANLGLWERIMYGV